MPEEQRKSSSSSEFKNFAPRDLSSLFCFVFLPSLPSTVVVYAMTGAPWLQNFRDKGFAYPLPAFSEDEAATMVEKFRRLDDEMQKVVQESLFCPCCRACAE